MSRCFPFSHEAYTSRSSNREVSIKLQKEKDELKTVKRKVEDKKSKKELKREHKHKGKKLRKEQKKINEHNKSKLCVKDGHLLEKLGHKSEQLEKSDITVENDLPSGSLNFLDSVDSRNKRKRQDGPAEPASTSQRTTFRIRLPLKKHGEPNTPEIEFAGQPKSCPMKESATCVPLKKHREPSPPEIEFVNQPNTCPTKEVATCVKETAADQVSPAETSSHSERRKKKISKSSTLYSQLIEDWVWDPPSLARCDSDDEDWLVGSRPQLPREPKRDCGGDEACRPLWPPQAVLLPEVGVYALPYTLPY